MNQIAIAGGNDHYILDAQLQDATADIDIELIWKEKYGVSLIMPQTSALELTDLDADLPSDTHLVTYVTADNEKLEDGVRAYKASDIFDAYNDAGYVVLSIKSGFGRQKPKLWTGS